MVQKRKAQASVEFLALISFVLVFLVIIWVTLQGRSVAYDEQVSIAYSRNTVEKIKQAVDAVYVQGEPALMKIDIYVPKRVESIEIIGKTIIFKVRTRSGLSDVHATTLATIIGNLTTETTTYPITVAAGDGYVNITY